MEINDQKTYSKNSSYREEEIDFKELFLQLWNGKVFIISVTALFSISAVFYSLSLPDIYKSSAILTSNSQSSGSLTNIANQYSGIANMAGISLPSSGEEDKVAQGIAVIQSYDFFQELVQKNNLFFKLLAPQDWDKDTNSLVINSEIYNINSKQWVSNAQFSVNGRPSMQSSHRLFLNNFSISRDKKTGFVSIAYNHFSPHIAKEFIDTIISEINEIARLEDIAIAQDTMDFLKDEANKTQFNDVKIGINILIQKQVEKISIAKSTPQYLFKILSKPYSPELKFAPQRSFICILAFIIGFITSSLLILVRYLFFNNQYNTNREE